MRTFILSAAILLAACGQAKKEKAPEQEVRNEIPPLSVTLITGERVMMNSQTGSLILVFYNPDCDHCQREAQAIANQFDSFRNYTLYFIAPGAFEDMSRFAATYGLADFSNVHFAQAEVSEVIRLLGPFPTPTLYIYSAEQRLVKKFNGETDVHEIVKFL